MSAIITYPDTFLRSVSQNVEIPLNEDNKTLIMNMKDTMYRKKGIGLAAIQIGYQRRICVIDTSASKNQPITIINPEVLSSSEESLEIEEGCLSAPGKFGHPRRNLRITIAYNCEHGKKLKKTFYDVTAQCVQHEIDHMNGKLCIDYDKT
jgi:peptide deformylase